MKEQITCKKVHIGEKQSNANCQKAGFGEQRDKAILQDFYNSLPLIEGMVKYTKIALAWWGFFSPVLRLCKKWMEKYTDLPAIPNYAEKLVCFNW